MANTLLPIRYVPKQITKHDKQQQVSMLMESRRLYKSRKYYTREKLPSYKSIKSKHLAKVYKIYGVNTIAPNKELAAKTGCKVSALKKIVKKGEGAYYSSGSRPNQTPQSWGLARLASSLTAGKSAAVDYDIIDKGCDHNKTAYILATKAKKAYGYGHSATRKTRVKINAA